MMKRIGLWLLWISLELTVQKNSVWPQHHVGSMHAERMVNVGDKGRYVYGYERFYFWQSNHRLLYYQSPMQMTQDPLLLTKNYGWRFLDITNGKSMLCKAISRLHAAYTSIPGGTALLSPDGKWLLTWGAEGEPEGPTQEVGDLSMVDGTHHKHLKPTGSPYICWLDDGRHWIEWDYITYEGRFHQVRIHSVNDDTVRELRVPWRGGLKGEVDLEDGRFVSLERLLILFPANYIGVDEAGFLEIGEWDLQHPGSAKRMYKIPVGKDAKISAVRFSSGGKRVACLYSAKNRRSWQIRVSNLDGTNVHDVTGLPLVSGDNEFAISQLDWSPDGKRLSFVYDDSIWVVPAD
jgi:hypothetical protein